MTIRAIAPTTGGGSPIIGTTITATTKLVTPRVEASADSSVAIVLAGANLKFENSGLVPMDIGPSAIRLAIAETLGWGVFGVSANDTAISRVSGGIVGVGTGSAAAFDGTLKAVAYQQAGANGQILAVQQLTELTTIAAAATTDTTIQMPAGAVVLAVDVRVTVVIPTAATFTVGDSGSATRFSTAAVAVAAGSTDAGTKAGAYYNASALSVRITPNAQPADNSGRVRVTIHYYIVTPATS